jgi:hypothetical protein
VVLLENMTPSIRFSLMNIPNIFMDENKKNAPTAFTVGVLKIGGRFKIHLLIAADSSFVFLMLGEQFFHRFGPLGLLTDDVDFFPDV